MQLTPTFKIYTQPTTEPVEVVDFLAHNHGQGENEEVKVRSFLVAARKKVEEDTGIQLLTAVWKGYWDQFPRQCDGSGWLKPLLLPIGPIASVDSLIYTATDGTLTTWASSSYRTDLVRTPSRITPIFGGAWPVPQQVTNAITVMFTAGWTSADLVPDLAKQAIHLIASDWFRNREADFEMAEKLDVGSSVMSCYRSLIHALHWMVFDE